MLGFTTQLQTNHPRFYNSPNLGTSHVSAIMRMDEQIAVLIQWNTTQQLKRKSKFLMHTMLMNLIIMVSKRS